MSNKEYYQRYAAVFVKEILEIAGREDVPVTELPMADGSNAVERLGEFLKFFEQDSWIKIEDAKPGNMQWVHAVVEQISSTEKKRRWLINAQYTNGYGLVVDEEINGCEGFGNYHEGDDEYYAPEGFYEQETTHSETLFQLEDDQKVILWRPLLKFPKA